MDFSLVIDDDLAKELCDFKANRKCNTDIVQRLLHYYKDYPIFTKTYFIEYYKNDRFLKKISRHILNWDSIETISKSTIYKVILSSQRNVNFPYISIYDDKIENNFTATFFKNESREKALNHLKSLLENAKYIFVYDLYLVNNWDSFIDFAQECFPQKQLSIFYLQEIHLAQHQCTQIIQMGNNQWHFSPDRSHTNFSNLHDRYLIIDNKIEVIFTSGIHHLMNTKKDFTYIVRQHKQ